MNVWEEEREKEGNLWKRLSRKLSPFSFRAKKRPKELKTAIQHLGLSLNL